MDAWLALLTGMVLLSRNLGLFALIVVRYGLLCDGNHTHVQGRGHDLKEAEGYSYRMTDLIHRAFHAASIAQEQQPQQRHCERSSNQTLRPELSKWPTPESFPKARRRKPTALLLLLRMQLVSGGTGVRSGRHDGPFLAVDAHDCH